MDLRGEVVIHKVFGSGRIVEFTNKYLTVLFDGNDLGKEFVYPSAFGSFLQMKNESFLNQIQADINEIAVELAKNKKISDDLKVLTQPIGSIKVKAKPKKSTTAKTVGGKNPIKAKVTQNNILGNNEI